MQVESNWHLDCLPRERLEGMLWQAINEVRRLRNQERRQAETQAMAAALVMGAILATAGFAFGSILAS